MFRLEVFLSKKHKNKDFLKEKGSKKARKLVSMQCKPILQNYVFSAFQSSKDLNLLSPYPSAGQPQEQQWMNNLTMEEQLNKAKNYLINGDQQPY